VGEEWSVYTPCRAVAVVADLGTDNVAAFIADLNGSPVVVVHQLARHDPAVRAEALRVLRAAGVEAETIHEVLDGIRS
jgi:hypothetical protein